MALEDWRARKWWALEVLWDDGIVNARLIAGPAYGSDGYGSYESASIIPGRDPMRGLAFPHELLIRGTHGEIEQLVMCLRKGIRATAHLYQVHAARIHELRGATS